MASLGWLNLYGRGVPRDPGAAKNWFSQLLRTGSPEGAIGLAWMAEHGFGRAANLQEASRYYDQASAQFLRR
jgi:TPR repeat protein